MGKYGKKNHVSLNPLDANICLLGTPKVGKTTIMKQVAEKLVGEDGYLFLEMYREGGAKYIENIVYEDVPDWETFIDIIDDIVDNRMSDYKDLKVVFIDTYDNAIQLAEQEALRLWNKANPDKRTDSINASWGGFMKGQDKADDLLQEQLFKLRSVGIAFTIIGHIRTTNITDPITQETYQQLTSDVPQRYFNKLKKNIDLIGIAYVDREIVQEKTGKKNIVTKKEDVVNRIASETRKIKFRDSNYTVDAGGRFSEIVDEIPFDADEFIKALRDALEAEVKKGKTSVEDREKEDKAAEEKRMAEIAAAEEKNKAMKEVQEVISKISEYCEENKSDTKKLVPIAKAFKELGYKNLNEVDKLEDALAIAKLIEG